VQFTRGIPTSQTLRHFFVHSKRIKPCKTSTLTLDEVEAFLCKMETLTKMDEQQVCYFIFALLLGLGWELLLFLPPETASFPLTLCYLIS